MNALIFFLKGLHLANKSFIVSNRVSYRGSSIRTCTVLLNFTCNQQDIAEPYAIKYIYMLLIVGGLASIQTVPILLCHGSPNKNGNS